MNTWIERRGDIVRKPDKYREHDGGAVLIAYMFIGLFTFGFGFFIGWVVFA